MNETSSSVIQNMIHSEDEIRHVLHHLLPLGGLEGHETLMVYRNARNKYSKAFKQSNMKDGVRGIESCRTVEDAVQAAHKAGLCFGSIEREASAMYITINPRNVPEALKATHDCYFRWVEHKAGMSNKKVKRGDKQDFGATLDRVLHMNMLKTRSRIQFQMIDVDDGDPTTWLLQTTQAIGENAIEMIIKTKNGFHVVYRPKRMTQEAHRRLEGVLSSDPKSGADSKVSKGKGSMISCALPGGYQADHPTSIYHCNCEKSPSKLTSDES